MGFELSLEPCLNEGISDSLKILDQALQRRSRLDSHGQIICYIKLEIIRWP